MSTTCVMIPSKRERFLDQTIHDVVSKSSESTEVVVILDGYEPEKRVKHPRVSYLKLPYADMAQKRQGVNLAVAQTNATYVMTLDAHCMVSEGFDCVLESDCPDDGLLIPRRLRLDAEQWCPKDDGRPPVDYEYWMYKDFVNRYLASHNWSRRTLERMDLEIDTALTCQASCWFMTKAWFNKMGLMQVEGFTGWGQQGEEVCLKTHFAGGRALVDKRAWFAHLHKGKQYGRMYHLDWSTVRKVCYEYSYYMFVDEHREQFVALIREFWPLPGWPEDWEDKLGPRECHH